MESQRGLDELQDESDELEKVPVADSRDMTVSREKKDTKGKAEIDRQLSELLRDDMKFAIDGYLQKQDVEPTEEEQSEIDAKLEGFIAYLDGIDPRTERYTLEKSSDENR